MIDFMKSVPWNVSMGIEYTEWAVILITEL